MNEDLRTFYELVRRTRAGVLDWFESLPPEVLARENPDFAFGSIAGIYSHIADTYRGWVGSVGLGEQEVKVRERDVPGLRAAFREVDAAVERGLASFRNPDEPFEWSSRKWGTLTLTGRWLLLHPITHEFHHKGQALALARVLGHPHPGNPDTDLIWPVPRKRKPERTKGSLMSSKSVAQKLLLRPNMSLWISHPERIELLGALPEGVKRVDRPGEADVSVLFADTRSELRGLLEEHGERLKNRGSVWVTYPKGNRADINRDSLWPMVAEHGLRPISQVAIDEVWSALRFRPLKEGEKQFSGGKS